MSLKVIHFQSIFLIYMQKCGITHQTTVQQEIQEKEEIAVKGVKNLLTRDVATKH